jgi:hypothetical protein
MNYCGQYNLMGEGGILGIYLFRGIFGVIWGGKDGGRGRGGDKSFCEVRWGWVEKKWRGEAGRRAEGDP